MTNLVNQFGNLLLIENGFHSHQHAHLALKLTMAQKCYFTTLCKQDLGSPSTLISSNQRRKRTLLSASVSLASVKRVPFGDNAIADPALAAITSLCQAVWVEPKVGRLEPTVQQTFRACENEARSEEINPNGFYSESLQSECWSNCTKRSPFCIEHCFAGATPDNKQGKTDMRMNRTERKVDVMVVA